VQGGEAEAERGIIRLAHSRVYIFKILQETFYKTNYYKLERT